MFLIWSILLRSLSRLLLLLSYSIKSHLILIESFSYSTFSAKNTPSIIVNVSLSDFTLLNEKLFYFQLWWCCARDLLWTTKLQRPQEDFNCERLTYKIVIYPTRALGNYFVYKSFPLQTLMWSLELVNSMKLPPNLLFLLKNSPIWLFVIKNFPITLLYKVKNLINFSVSEKLSHIFLFELILFSTWLFSLQFLPIILSFCQPKISLFRFFYVEFPL